MKLFKFALLILTCALSTAYTSAININTTLIEAIKHGNLATVKELIKKEANINYENKNKETPLILAVEYAKPLAEFYGQAQARFKSRWQERKKIIQILLEAGANINHVNKWGNTALMIAIKNHDLNTVLDLLKIPEITKGSFFGFGEKPINYANKDGNTALIIAIKHVQTSYLAGNNHSYHTCLNSQKIVDALSTTPEIDFHHVNNNGETAISLFNELKAKRNFGF